MMNNPAFCSKGEAAFDWLKVHSASAKEIQIAVAFLDKRTAQRLLDALSSTLAREDAMCLLLWAEPFDRREDPELLRFLQETKQKYRNQFYTRRMSSRHASVFHPKVFIFRDDRDRLSILIGSANLTSAGMDQNVEACLGYEFRFQELPVWAADLLREFDHWWAQSNKIETGISDPPVEHGGGEKPPKPPLRPPIPGFREKIEQALSECLIVGIDVYTKHIRLQLPRDLLGIGREEISGSVLAFRHDSSLSLLVVPTAIDDEIKNLRNFARARIRRFTLGTPWGRLVTPSGKSVLKSELPEIDRRIAQSLQNVKQLAVNLPFDFEQTLRSDFRRIWEKLYPAEAQPVEVVARVLELATQARERFLSFDPLPFDARVRLTRPLDRSVSECDPYLSVQIDACRENDLRLFLIKAASVPRRSLLKYRMPDAAKRLCLLPDPGLEEALRHRWRAADSETESRQLSIVDGRTLDDIKKRLQAEVEEIHSWHSLPLEDVLSRYEALLAPKVCQSDLDG